VTTTMSEELIWSIQNKANEKVFELSEAMEAGEINKVVWGDIRDTTALHEACGGCNDQALDKLLNKTGIDVNIKNANGWTPLHAAVPVNNVYGVSRLLTSPGIQVNSTTTYGVTPVMFSARDCNVEILKMMLEDPRVDLDTKDGEGNGLEELVGRDAWGGREEEKEKCQTMINNEKKKRKSGPIVQRRIEKVDRLNEKIGGEEEKLKRNVEISEQKRKNLKRQQTLETENLAKKRKEEDAQLAKKRKEEDTQLAKKNKEEETQLAKKHEEEEKQLEAIIKVEAEANQRYIGLLREQRDEQVGDLQKTRIDPAQDDSEDRHKLEAAVNKQEAAERALECPVCFDHMRHPMKIWMCENSHLICEACKDKLKARDLLGGGKCPTCTTQPITLRSHKSEELARIIFN